jgi:hypothetical protein
MLQVIHEEQPKNIQQYLAQFNHHTIGDKSMFSNT